MLGKHYIIYKGLCQESLDQLLVCLYSLNECIFHTELKFGSNNLECDNFRSNNEKNVTGFLVLLLIFSDYTDLMRIYVKNKTKQNKTKTLKEST